MLTDGELAQIMHRLGLSAKARAVIEAARARASQRTQSGLHAPGAVISSTKSVVGIRLGLGGHRVEPAAILDLEYDPDVLAYWEAPSSLNLDFTRDSDRGFGILYTPALIVLRRGGAAFEDWDSEEGLRKWAATAIAPGRITRTVDGRWRCPPAEAAAAAYGLGHIQHSYADISPCVQANVDYLMACFKAGKRLPGVDKGLTATLVDAVSRNPSITVAKLRQDAEQKVGPAAADPDRVAEAINVLVIRQGIYVNLRAARLAEPDRARVYANEATAQAFSFIAAASGLVDTSQPDLTAEGRELLVNARREDLVLANERFRALSPLVSGATVYSREECALPRSTCYRLVRKYREAARRYGTGYIGLLPAYGKCGHRGSRYDSRTTDLVQEYVAKYYMNLHRSTRRVAYYHLVAACEQEGVPCPSYAYFARRVNTYSCTGSEYPAAA